jgi:DnaJ-class molecular chaperone
MEIKMSDLQNKCDKCDGQGTVENPAMAKQNRSYGSHLIRASPVECNACSGRGFILTESGETILQFLRLANSKHPKLF